jgi:reactive intermediate/imine deaminase
MAKQPIVTDTAAPPGGAYSQAIVAGDLVFCAGCTPTLPDGEWLRGSFAEQATQSFENLKAVAAAAGCTLADAVRVGVYLVDMDDFPEMNRIYREYFPEPLPARTTIQSNLPGFLIEVDAVLLRPTS